MSSIDQLSQLAALLGADAAWVLRGFDEIALTGVYDAEDEDERPTTIPIFELGEFGVVFAARFPDDGVEELGVQETRQPGKRDPEIAAAAALFVVLDNLTRIGPSATARVLEWLFKRYGIEPSSYGGGPWKVRDRRNTPAAPVVAPPPPPPSPPPSATETARLELPADPPDPPASYGEQLRKRRVALGLTQKDLSERVGIARLPTYRVSQIERGKFEPRDELVEAINRALEAAEQEQAEATKEEQEP